MVKNNIVMENALSGRSKMSKLITDMTIRGALPDELCKAIKQSIVVIDEENALKGLNYFDAKESYKAYPGMSKITDHIKQIEVDKISNLITDMTIGGATLPELCKAVKHSIVVIDSEKYNLDYERSFTENGIEDLKKKYQI